MTDTLDPSCTEAGYQVYICTGCGERDTRALDPLGHTPGEAVRENETPATCTADSSYDLVVYCAACEAELNRETVVEYGTARGHVWDGGVQTVAPSSEAEGVMTYTCLNCGETVTKPIEKLPPMPVKVIFDSGIEGTEIEVYPRPTEDEPKPEPIEPEADETWLLLPGQYEYIAEAEGYERVDKTPFTVRTLVEGEKELKIDLSLTPIHVHKYAVTETHEPGCTEQGYTVYTCECGDSYTEYTDPIGSHLWQEAERIPATVAAEGSVFYICQRCGEEKTEALPKLEVMPVTVIPMLTPEDALVVVHPSATDQNPAPAEVPKQTDGSWLLMPGDYIWSALADGYTPAFDVPFTVPAQADGESYTLTVTLEKAADEPVVFARSAENSAGSVSVSAPAGAFPADAVLTVSDPMPERRTLKAASITPFAAVPETDDGAGFITAKSYSYEIAVTDAEGNHLQPAEGMTVTLSFALAEADDPNLIPRVLHEGKEIPCYTEDGAVIAETTGFSRYTVEFCYTEKEYVMPGDSEIPMSEILSTLGLTGEVTAVEISDTSLFSASNETGEWIVTDRNNRSAEFLYLDINFI